VRDKLRAVSDPIERQQFFDFLNDRGARQTLLCHARVALQRELNPTILGELYVASATTAVTNIDPRSENNDQFTTSAGRSLVTSIRLPRRCLWKLSAVYPFRIRFGDLVDAIVAESPQFRGATNTPRSATELVWALYLRDAVELYPRQIDFPHTPSDRPVARRLARLLAGRTDKLPNLLQKAVRLDATSRRVLPLLDGTRGRNELVNEFVRLFDAGELPGGLQCRLFRLINANRNCRGFWTKHSPAWPRRRC